SMYFDEDGDLAHEFYEETIVTKNGRKRAKLKRIQKNLTPQVGNLNHQKENSLVRAFPGLLRIFFFFFQEV
ncbi:Tumor suppressor candidate 2, partial [Xenoophorus captivus]